MKNERLYQPIVSTPAGRSKTKRTKKRHSEINRSLVIAKNGTPMNKKLKNEINILNHTLYANNMNSFLNPPQTDTRSKHSKR